MSNEEFVHILAWTWKDLQIWCRREVSHEDLYGKQTSNCKTQCSLWTRK